MLLVLLSSDLDLFQGITIRSKVGTTQPCGLDGALQHQLFMHAVKDVRYHVLRGFRKSQDTLRGRKLSQLCLPTSTLASYPAQWSRSRYLQPFHKPTNLRVAPYNKNVCQHGRPKALRKTRQALQDHFWYPSLHYSYISGAE